MSNPRYPEGFKIQAVTPANHGGDSTCTGFSYMT
ncbi:hypothetical protein C4K04_4682 [Pseudomonas chlororaphis]|uniref:Uncharacterized protein n=1 Tax=Pseudomonas chlororaphis TaxID=587753 RepID=A0A3G7TT96_9PSED|nr:hypothetical protein C4K04_4682 [Pseudomonas chlororaphis]